MKITIDDAICDDFVYEVNIKVEANKMESYYQTTFNRKQQETAINRAIRFAKIDKMHVKHVHVRLVQKLGYSQLK